MPCITNLTSKMCATSSAQDQQGIAASLHLSSTVAGTVRLTSLWITLTSEREEMAEGKQQQGLGGWPHAAGPDRKQLRYPPKPKVNGLPELRANSNDAASVFT